MAFKHALGWLALACSLWLGFAVAAPLSGSPAYVRIQPDTDAEAQNFAIVQDSHGVVYLGNASGVLEYDGERWSLIPIDNREIVRSLAVDESDRVWVGGYNAIGYLQRDAGGQSAYVDLTARFRALIGEREFADVWDTVVTPEGVYFRALRDLFFLDTSSEQIRHWHHENRFGTLAHHRGQTLIQFRTEGFRVRDGDAWLLLDGTEHLQTLIYGLIPLGDGGLLTLGASGEWWRLLDGPVRPVEMPAGLPPSSDFEHSLVLADGSIALASRDGSLHIVDPGLRQRLYFQLDPGFLSGLHRARDGGFLVAADGAMYHVEWPPSWSVLGAEHGASGSLVAMAQWNGADYLLGSAGVARVEAQAGTLSQLISEPWGSESAYDLIGLDAGRALVAGHFHIQILDSGSLRQLNSDLIYPRSFFASNWRRQRIYIGTENGLRYVDSESGEFRVSAAIAAGFEMRVTSLVETSASQLWFGTTRHGLIQATLDDAGVIIDQQRWLNQRGLQVGAVPSVHVAQWPGGRLIVSSHAGLFEWHGEQFVATDLDGLAQLRGTEEFLHLALDPSGGQWAYSSRRLFQRPPDGNWLEHPIRGLVRGSLMNHSFDSAGHARLVASQSLLLQGSGQRLLAPKPPQVRLTAVSRILPDGQRESLPLNAEHEPQLVAGDYAIQFQFALPDLAHLRGRAYQARLLGYEESYSEWAPTRGFSYSRLKPGRYELQVRARDAQGRVSEIVPYRLQILPPWYASAWAQALWVLLAAAALVVLVQASIRRRVAKLAAQTQTLEAMIAERTRDLAAANARLDSMAHLDGLTGIANRRRLDDFLDALWAQATPRPLSVLAIDVDRFKDYNDRNGHQAGDRMLKDLVQCLGTCLRRSEDLLARYGGEEFIAVLPGADTTVALGIAQSMRTAVEQAQLGATVSIGVAQCSASTASVVDLLRAADTALYEAKRQGRNRVQVAADGPA